MMFFHTYAVVLLLLGAQTFASPTPASASSAAVVQSAAASPASSTAATLPISTLAPKVLFIANTFEYSSLEGYNFSKAYTGPMLDQTFNCTEDGQTCMLAVGQELVSAMSIQALELIRKVDLTKTYIFLTGTGGVNPKYGTAGGVAISRFCIQWEWGSMFLGDDLPANFSGQYFYAYAQEKPSDYPYLVGTEVYELNNGLVERFYNLAKSLPYEEVEDSLQTLRKRYNYPAAKSTPFLSRCDTASAQVYWHGDVAVQNVEYYADLVTNGTAQYCNTNEDDQGRLVALFAGAVHKKVDSRASQSSKPSATLTALRQE
jgi:purine nucleoside permease